MGDLEAAGGIRQRAFALLLLLSGFCGISYEILYARILSNTIGDQFAVTSSILVTFMLGIGAGTLAAHRLWRYLWAIEGAIGLCGVAFAFGAPLLERLYYGSVSPGSGLGSAMIFCFVLLALPSFLIGCSLPLFAGYLGRLVPGGVFARAYMVYNFGAALTVLVIEFWLFRVLGLRDTVLTMAALNGVVSLSLLFGFRELRLRPESSLEPLSIPASDWLAIAIASVASAIFQLLMVRLAECFLGPFRETFALVIAVVLFGIALGSAVLRRWRPSLAVVLGVATVGVLWLLLGFAWTTRVYAALKPGAAGHPAIDVLLRVGALVVLMGVPVVAFGATIPALLRRSGTVARDSGRLLFVASTANGLGFLLMAFALHRYLDYGVIIVVVAALSSFALVVTGRGRLRPVVTGLALFGAVVVAHRVAWSEKPLYLGYYAFRSPEALAKKNAALKSVERFKGYQDVFALLTIGNQVHFFTNGYVSIALETAAERVVGAFPALFAPRTDRALVLGVGSGITTGTVALLFDHVDAVEINPVVLDNLHRMSRYNFDLSSRKNITLFVDDAIHFVRVHQETYSLIITTVTSPRYFSSAKIYTQDFFDVVKKRLTPDGVYVTWVDMLVGQRGLDIMLETAQRSFPHCALGGVNSGYLLLLCGNEPLVLHHPDLAARNFELTAYLEGAGLRADRLAYGLLTTHAQDAIRDPNVPINTRDFPSLEFQAASPDPEDSEAFADPLIEHLDLSEIRKVLEPAMAFDAAELVRHAEALYGDSDIVDRWKELAESPRP